MKKQNILKNVLFYVILLTTTFVSSQKITFKIENNSLSHKILITGVNDEVLKSIFDKENRFEVDYLSLDEGFYLLKKDGNTIVLYLKPTDAITIAFDDDDFYKSLNFSGEGAYVNSYLLKKRTELVNRKGNFTKFYKKSFYEDGETEYIDKLDKLYKDNYGVLFSSQLSKKFIDEEMKNLQYGYSLDLLRYQDAKKYYKFKDSLAPSKSFLEPLNHVHFQNNQLYKKYNSYKELAVLKWKKDIENLVEYPLKQDVISSLRINPLKEAVLGSLADDMNRNFPERTKVYYELIKKNTDDNKLLLKAREKYAEIKYVEATKNLSKFKFKNLEGEQEKLIQYKGKFIFLNIWTTWCSPCLKKFEELKELEERFKDENIVFLSISVDKVEDFFTWVNLTKENYPEGKHLFLDGSKIKFIKAYNLLEIPTYVLLSPKGVPIKDIEIKKLSSKKTQKEIETLLKK